MQPSATTCALVSAMQSSPSNATAELAHMLSSAIVRGVLDSLPDAMVIIDSSGKILFANAQVDM